MSRLIDKTEFEQYASEKAIQYRGTYRELADGSFQWLRFWVYLDGRYKVMAREQILYQGDSLSDAIGIYNSEAGKE